MRGAPLCAMGVWCKGYKRPECPEKVTSNRRSSQSSAADQTVGRPSETT